MHVELLETIKQQINQLNAQEEDQLARYLHKRKRANGVEAEMEVTERERKRRLRAAWLNAHGAEYGGLYVALDGDRLLGTGKNYPEAYDAAKAAGAPNAYVGFVYPENYEGSMGPEQRAAAPDVAEEEARQQHMEWMKAHREEYAGQYVALDGDRLVGQGQTLAEANRQARQNGVSDPFLVRLTSENEVLFGGW